MRDPVGYHLEAYRRHGPIYRTTFFGHETLCLGGLDANDFIWGNAANFDYGASRKVFGEQFGPAYLTQLDGEPHKKKRRRLNPAFRPDFLMRASAGMTAALNANLAAAAGTEVELRRFCYKMLIRMTSTALLGLTLPPDVEDAILLVERDLLIGSIFSPIRQYWLNRPAYHRSKKKVIDYLGQLVDRWMHEPGHGNDMFAAAIKNQPDEEPLTRDELIGDLYLLLTGGLNSTANLALWSLMYIFHRPDWLAQLREEIAAVPPAAFTAMKQWPRIKATALEIERLRPATPLLTFITAQDFEFKGLHVPKGTALTHFLTLTHYLPEIYGDPENFRPERFLGETEYPARTHVPFGGGAHI
jgi:cytochrome P450